MNERNKVRQELRNAEAGLTYSLEVFGDALAKREKYKSDLDGLDAVRYYLMQKHHWLPRDVNSMSFDDLRFALSEELAAWTLPKAAR